MELRHLTKTICHKMRPTRACQRAVNYAVNQVPRNNKININKVESRNFINKIVYIILIVTSNNYTFLYVLQLFT